MLRMPPAHHVRTRECELHRSGASYQFCVEVEWSVEPSDGITPPQETLHRVEVVGPIMVDHFLGDLCVTRTLEGDDHRFVKWWLEGDVDMLLELAGMN